MPLKRVGGDTTRAMRAVQKGGLGGAATRGAMRETQRGVLGGYW
jgi:hypothetical protein